MKIGVNARLLLDGPLEGLGRYTFETVAHMALSNPNDEFILFFDRKIETKYLVYPNMQGVLIFCPTRHPFLILFWFEILLPFFLRKYKIDVFYSADNFLSLSTKIPTILICHDLAYLDFPEGISKSYLLFYKYFTPKYLKKAAIVGTVSEYVREELLKHFPFLTSIFVAPNALPSHEFDLSKACIELKLNKPYFIYVGSIHPRKNIKKMLSAFLTFNKENDSKYGFVLIGRLAWATQNIQPLLSSENIHTIFNANDKEKFEWIKNSLALVYISLSEGFGIPILEGFACNVPVITSNISSMPEVGGDAVLKVNPHSEDEIVGAFNKICKDKFLKTQLIEKGKIRLNIFSWNNTAHIIFSNLKQLHKKNL